MKAVALLIFASSIQSPFGALRAAPPPNLEPARAAPGVEAVPAPVDAGLSVTVAPSKARFARNEAARFTLTFKNISNQAFLLYDVGWPNYAIIVDDRWTAGREPGPAIARVAPGPADSVLLPPGKSISFDFDMAGRGYWEKDPQNPDSMINRIEQLPLGKHRLVVNRTLGMNPAPARYPHAHWLGAITHKPAEFEIIAAAK